MKASPKLYLGWTGTEWVWAPFLYTDDLAQSQASMVSTTNATAYSILQPTDWYVVRYTENGEPVPLQINSWRQEIRDEAKAKIVKINAATTKDELLTYTTSVEYETWSNEPVILAE